MVPYLNTGSLDPLSCPTPVTIVTLADNHRLLMQHVQYDTNCWQVIVSYVITNFISNIIYLLKENILMNLVIVCEFIIKFPI